MQTTGGTDENRETLNEIFDQDNRLMRLCDDCRYIQKMEIPMRKHIEWVPTINDIKDPDGKEITLKPKFPFFPRPDDVNDHIAILESYVRFLRILTRTVCEGVIKYLERLIADNNDEMHGDDIAKINQALQEIQKHMKPLFNESLDQNLTTMKEIAANNEKFKEGDELLRKTIDDANVNLSKAMEKIQLYIYGSNIRYEKGKKYM
eukprot:3366169-Rhodomonas_salina.1